MPASSLYPLTSASRPRRRPFPIEHLVPAAGVAMLLMLGAAYLFIVSLPARLAPALNAAAGRTAGQPATATPAPQSESAGPLEEGVTLSADNPTALAIHPQGEMILTASGGDMNVRVQNGEFTVQATNDGAWRVRALHPDVRGEVALQFGQEMYPLRLRADLAAPLHRRIWLSQAAPAPTPILAGPDTEGVHDAATAKEAESKAFMGDATTLLGAIIDLEAKGPGGEGAGDFGRGDKDGLLTHWRRTVRHGNVCGAVVDLTCQRPEPIFYEPSSLAIELPERGVPDVLARSGAGVVMPGQTVPAVVVWFDPLPTGTAAESNAAREAPAGPYALSFHPWQLPWRELAILAAPTPPPKKAGTASKRHGGN